MLYFSAKSDLLQTHRVSKVILMEICARCGEELAWHKQKMVFWNSNLRKGYIKWFVIGSMQFGKRKDFPEYTGKKLCQLCADEVFNGPASPESKEALANNQEKKKPQSENISVVIADFASLTCVPQRKRRHNVCVRTAQNAATWWTSRINGKILICKHCGNPIKPTDIFEKIKSLID